MRLIFPFFGPFFAAPTCLLVFCCQLKEKEAGSSCNLNVSFVVQILNGSRVFLFLFLCFGISKRCSVVNQAKDHFGNREQIIENVGA